MERKVKKIGVKKIGAVVVNEERCKGCGLCVAACGSGVLALHVREMNGRGYHYVYVKGADGCVGCANCGWVCPEGCLTVYKERGDGEG